MWECLSWQQRDDLIEEVQRYITKTRPRRFVSWPNDIGGKPIANNIPQALLRAFLSLSPLPRFSIEFVGAMASAYMCGHEVMHVLEDIAHSGADSAVPRRALDVLMMTLNESCDRDLVVANLRLYSMHPWTDLALSLEMFSRSDETQSMTREAIANYAKVLASQAVVKSKTELHQSTLAEFVDVHPFEVEVWETRWVEACKDLSQWAFVLDVANSQNIPDVAIECASVRCEWDKVKALRVYPSVVARLECGSLKVKLIDIMLSVIENKAHDVERLCAQSVQLALSQWQLLPPISCGSVAHKAQLHSFHRIIELRESAGLMHEVFKASREKTLPDLKGVLKNWRWRLPQKVAPYRCCICY